MFSLQIRRTSLILIIAASTTVRAGQLAPSGVDLSGNWALDVYLSDRSEQVVRALQFDTGDAPPGGFDSAQDFPGARGRGGAERARRDPRKPEDRKRLTELTTAVRFPPLSLTISQTPTTVTLAAGGGPAQTLQTDGKAEKLQLEAGAVERRASWQGPQLTLAYEIGGAGRLTYTYSIAPTTKQLLIRVNFEQRPGEPGPFEIRLVYNRAATT